VNPPTKLLPARAGHGLVRAGFGPFDNPTRACRVWKFPTRDSNENMKNRRVSGGSDRVFFYRVARVLSGILVNLQTTAIGEKFEERV
jgi:hypothetical protein